MHVLVTQMEPQPSYMVVKTWSESGITLQCAREFSYATYTVCQSNVDAMTSSNFVSGLVASKTISHE